MAAQAMMPMPSAGTAPGDAEPGPPPEASLLGLDVRRRRPANAGWCAGRQNVPLQSERERPPAARDAGRQPVVQPRGAPAAPPDILSYWRQCRHGARFPAWPDLDQDEILARWPSCILLRWDESLMVPRPEAAFTEALRAAKRKDLDRVVPEIEYSPQVTEWLLLLGKQVARRGAPLQDSQLFPTLKGRVRYQATGLPLGGASGRVELVLCHLARV